MSMATCKMANRTAGPSFWGLINPEWSMCNRGRRQSPINIEPSELLFDPNLRPLHIDKNAVNICLTLKSYSYRSPPDLDSGGSRTDRDLERAAAQQK